MNSAIYHSLTTSYRHYSWGLSFSVCLVLRLKPWSFDHSFFLLGTYQHYTFIFFSLHLRPHIHNIKNPCKHSQKPQPPFFLPSFNLRLFQLFVFLGLGCWVLTEKIDDLTMQIGGPKQFFDVYCICVSPQWWLQTSTLFLKAPLHWLPTHRYHTHATVLSLFSSKCSALLLIYS